MQTLASAAQEESEALRARAEAAEAAQEALGARAAAAEAAAEEDARRAAAVAAEQQAALAAVKAHAAGAGGSPAGGGGAAGGGGGVSPPHSLAELAEFARRERERFEDVAAAHRQRLARPALLLQGASPFAKTPRPMPSPAGSLQERLRAVQQKFGSASDARVSSIGARR